MTQSSRHSKSPYAKPRHAMSHHSKSQWLVACEAVIRLALARLRHASVPSAKIIAALRAPHPVRTSITQDNVDRTREIAWALSAAARRVPWRADCLVQCIAAAAWLRANGIAPDFHLGVAKDDTGQLKAHAWIMSGDVIVAGGNAEGYEVLIAPDKI